MQDESIKSLYVLYVYEVGRLLSWHRRELGFDQPCGRVQAAGLRLNFGSEASVTRLTAKVFGSVLGHTSSLAEVSPRPRTLLK